MAAAWRTQRNVRVQAVLALLALGGGCLLRLPAASWAILALAIGLVLTAELANTALEAVVDLVSPDRHPLAKRAKDVAAGAVLVASAAALTAGACVVAQALAR